MTRNRKVDTLILEREYIFDPENPPISISGLAERHGLARSGVAEKAREGRWYERRVEFRKQLGEKVVSNLQDSWAVFETQTRERMMRLGGTYLDKYAEALEAGEVKVNTRDMLGIAAMLRTFLNDAANATVVEHPLIDPDKLELDPTAYEEGIGAIKQLLANYDAATQSGNAGSDASAGPEGEGQD